MAVKKRLTAFSMILLSGILTTSSFAAGYFALAKYNQTNRMEDQSVTAIEFYFTSDRLSSDTAAQDAMDPDTPVTVHLYNYQTDNSKAISAEDIHYSCTVTYYNDSAAVADQTTFTGSLTGGSRQDNSFQVANAYPRAVADCTSQSSLTATLHKTFLFTKVPLEYEVRDPGEGYIILDIYTGDTSLTSLTINYDSTKFVPDNSSHYETSFSAASGTLSIAPYTTYDLEFYKISNAAAPYIKSRQAVTGSTITLN